MPRIHRLNNGALYIYANDHAPPHFHVVGPDSNARIGIDSLEILRGRCSRRDFHEAVEWALAHQDFLLQRWREINERD
jgi:hypothetical protein